MRPDPGRAVQESIIASMSTLDRTAAVASLRANGRWAVWQQVDAAGLEDPLAIAEFILRRLYPNEPERLYAEVLDQLRAARDAGAWTGFARPESRSSIPVRSVQSRG